MDIMRMLTTPVMLLALVLVSTPFMLAFAESSAKNIEASGTVALFNSSPHSGLWAAGADIDKDTGNLVAVFKNDNGDIFVITIAGEDLVLDENGLTIAGKGFVAQNGVLLKEGNGTGKINENGMQIRVNGDIVISGQTTSFEMK
ncbi:MAG: hypothetical protein ACE5KA_03325 [Nitrososphaerales archaeon]